MIPRLVLALLPFLTLPLTAAEPHPDGKALAKEISPYLDDRTVLVAHLDLSRLEIGDLKDALAAVSGLDPRETEEETAQIGRQLAAFRKAGGTRVFVVFSLADLFEGPFFIVPMGEGTNKEALGKVFGQLGLPYPLSGLAQLEGAVFYGPPKALARVRNGKPGAARGLAAVLDDPNDSPLRIAVVAGSDTRRVLGELLPPLPPQWGGVDLKPFLRDLRWVRVSATLKPLGVRVTALCPDEETAGRLREDCNKILLAVRKQLENQAGPMTADLTRFLSLQPAGVSGTRLVLDMNEKDLIQAFRPALRSLRGARTSTTQANNLKQIGMALYAYHDAMGVFPAAASYDPMKKPLLSWRVHLLPYLGQTELYKQFKLDEAWDSPHNKTLIGKMPPVYAPANPKLAATGRTTILAPRGDQTMFPGPTGVRIVEVTDGTANTIFLVVAQDDRAVVWTQPEDLPFDPRNPHAGLGFDDKDLATILMVDGSVRTVPKSMDKNNLKAAFTRNAGDVVEWK